MKCYQAVGRLDLHQKQEARLYKSTPIIYSFNVSKSFQRAHKFWISLVLLNLLSLVSGHEKVFLVLLSAARLTLSLYAPCTIL